MKRPICPKCHKHPCEKHSSGFRTSCWSCRVHGNPAAIAHYKAQDKIRRDRIKREVIDHYGGICRCCGENNIYFLTIDHINNDGAKHRRSLKPACRVSGASFYMWLKKHGFPNDLQVLCFNCNCGRYVNSGICPHKVL